MASVGEGAVSAGTSGIGALSVVAAACGGGFKGGGFEFPTLTTSGRVLLAVTGVALIVFEQFRSGNWHLDSKVSQVFGRRSMLVTATCSFLALLWLAFNRGVVADPASLPVSYCTLRSDTPTKRTANTYWVLEGFKMRSDSDSLDSDRNIYDSCARRTGDTMTIYRQTQVWRGLDPAHLISNGTLSIVRTPYVLLPGTKVRVIAELSGPVVMNDARQVLYYNVWAPIELPEKFDTNYPGSQ